MRQFGPLPPRDCPVTERPGAYAVLVDTQARVAVVTMGGRGGWLPGGGLEGAETPLQALHRELLEETGFTVEMQRKLGVLGQFMLHRGRWWNKMCHVWLCSPVRAAQPLEPGHEVHWLHPPRARGMLVHEAHRMAVVEASPQAARDLM